MFKSREISLALHISNSWLILMVANRTFISRKLFSHQFNFCLRINSINEENVLTLLLIIK